VELKISQAQQAHFQQMKSLEEQLKAKITRVQQFLSNFISENNAQITQLQTQTQSLESEMIDVEQVKHQDLQVNDQLRQAHVHFC